MSCVKEKALQLIACCVSYFLFLLVTALLYLSFLAEEARRKEPKL